ncbi:MAG: DUF2079 domain-containing protein [Patescibacteria group bacterium]|jgi:uncharacterized membrane protein|nr:DUF2079 domain-containing protein [Patescibacteria group bacterium]
MGKIIKKYKKIIIITLLYFLVFSLISCARHYTFQTQTWDLAVFEQSFYNTVHGKIMFNNFENGSHFAIHFSPFLFLIVPFYYFWQSPYLLLIIQSLALALGAWPLYLYARKIIGQSAGTLIAGLYLIHPSLQWVNLFDFHAVPFAIPLIFTAFYFLEEKKYFWTSVFLIFTASVAENMIVAVFFVGIYILFFKNQKYGAAVSILSLIYFILVAKIIMPWFGGGIVRLDRYSQFGGNASEIIINVITQPALTWQTIFAWSKFTYLIKLFLPVGFLALLSLDGLILLTPGLLQNLLTNFQLQYVNFYQYDSILIPFIFIGTVIAIAKFQARNQWSKTTTKCLVATAIFAMAWTSPLSPINFPWKKFIDPKIKDYQKIISLIPPDASVAAQTNLVAHLTHRESIAMTGEEKTLADYVIMDSQDLFGFPSQESFDRYLEAYQQTKKYELIEINNRYYILRKQKND